MASFLDKLDAQLASTLSDWNMYSTVLLVGIVTYVVYSIINPDEPDTHPMLLLRQSLPSLVRQPGESAVYRNHETPHGFPLKTGLNVKPAGSPMYSAGKDGDLRDVWRRVTGELPWEAPRAMGSNMPTKSEKGSILTVFGREKVRSEDIGALSKEIAAIGEAVKKSGSKRVAVYLPNSTELLTALFAGAFYSFDVVLLPYDQPNDACMNELQSTSTDALIASAGSLPLADLSKAVSGLKQVIWVVEETSRHMDWTEVSDNINIDVQQWHELVSDAGSAATSLPTDGEPGKVLLLSWQATNKVYMVSEYTQKNLIAAIGALVTCLPPTQRLNPSDLFLPADALTDSYTLCWTMAALFSHATVALNSVAGPDVTISESAKHVSPTVVVASAAQGSKLHSQSVATPAGVLRKLSNYTATQALQAGRLSVDGMLTKFSAPNKAALGTTPGKLRLLFLSEKVGASQPSLSGTTLGNLRVYTGARVVYALEAPGVAGAVAQRNIYDYRTGLAGGNYGSFGAPVASVELKLRDSGRWKTTDQGNPTGEIVVTGPAVAGNGEIALGVFGTFNDDQTLAYVDK